jgi:hypothetical protein
MRRLPLPKELTESEVHEMSETELKMGSLILGAKSEAGGALPIASDITVNLNGIAYDVHTHSRIRGRVDKLSKAYKIHNIRPGDKLIAHYDAERKTLYLKTYGIDDDTRDENFDDSEYSDKTE